MINENEYLADIYKLAGFALMTPFGKLILSIPDLNFDNLSRQLFIFLLLSIVFFLVSIILFFSGYAIVYKRNR